MEGVDWLIAAGVAGAALVMFVERFVPFAPSWAVLGAIGVAISEGILEPVPAIAASVAGSTAAAMVYFFIGRAVGRHAAPARLVAALPAAGRRSARLEACLAHPGTIVPALFVSQCIPLVRLLAPLPAGASSIPARRVVVPLAAGCTVWNAGFIGIGWALAA